jgi:membrane protease YdiL (CAAX protease family)
VRTVQQLGALAKLVWRHWSRSALFNPRQPPRLKAEAVSSGIVLRLVYLILICFQFSRVGATVAARTEARESASFWAIMSVILLAMSIPIVQEFPSARMRSVGPFLNPWLETLPLTIPARITRALLQSAMLTIPSAVLLVALAPELGAGPRLVLIVALELTATLVGLAIAYALRLVLPPHWVSRTGWLSILVLIGGGLGLFAAMGPLPLPFPAGLWPISAFARQAASGGPPWLGPELGAMAGLAALSLVLVKAVERRGFDRLESLAPGPQKRDPSLLTIPSAERRMARREQSPWILPLIVLLLAGFLSYLASSLPEPRAGWTAEMLRMIFTGTNGMVAYFGWLTALNLSTRSVQRDTRARTFLATLPISPEATLAGKAPFIQRQMLPAFALYVPLIVLLPRSEWPHAIMSALTMLATLWLLAGAMVSVAFLSGGLGARSAMSAGPVNLNTLLLSLPVMGVVAAPTALARIPPLLALGLLGFEARRAATRCVRWLDDLSEDGQDQTQTWRALMVFAAFVATQALVGRLLEAVLPDDTLLRAALSYAASAALLLALTYGRRQSAQPLAFRPRRSGYVLLGLGLGGLSGMIGLGYVRLLSRFGVELPALEAGAGGGLGSQLAFFLAVVALAPVAEEVFFRGWLQVSIAEDLTARRRPLAVLLAAIAFASVHPSLSFAPVLLLGVVAGALYGASGALLPGIAAHLAHNALAVAAELLHLGP